VLEHHLQKNIVRILTQVESQRFGELKPDTIDNKLFDYHLKKVMIAGLVEKLPTGGYRLTSLGRRVGKDVVRQSDYLIDRAYSVLFLVIRRSQDGAWLLCKRKTHPLLNMIGFMDAIPRSYESILQTAQETALAKTGLEANFTVRGSGYLRAMNGPSMESFTHFTALEATDVADTLQQYDELAAYHWQESLQLDESKLLPTVPLLIEQLSQPEQFFIEQSFQSRIE
jgi:hypothetical protein